MKKSYIKPELTIVKIDNVVSLGVPSDPLDELCKRMPCLKRCGGSGCGPHGGHGDGNPFSDNPFDN